MSCCWCCKPVVYNKICLFCTRKSWLLARYMPASSNMVLINITKQTVYITEFVGKIIHSHAELQLFMYHKGFVNELYNLNLNKNLKKMEISKEEKIRAINYVKAITIILMVSSHYTSSPLNRLSPYMYHMPLFFFLGGMLFNHTKSLKEHYSKVFLKHFMYIVLTYIIVGVMALCIHRFTNAPIGIVFEDSISLTVKKIINTGFSNNRYFLASWFLFSYMVIMLLSPFICRLLHKAPSPLIAGMIFAFLIGWVGIEITSVNYHQTKDISLNYLTQILVGGMFFIFGFSIKNHVFRIINQLAFSLLIITTIILYGLGMINVTGMSWSVYRLGFFFTTLGALLGIYCIFYISTILAKSVSLKWLEFIGEGSKDIMAYHLVVFSLLNIAAWKFYKFDISRNDILHSFSNEWSWVPYLIFGVIIPLGVTEAYKAFNKLALHLRRA